jgi:hypothetical protein
MQEVRALSFEVGGGWRSERWWKVRVSRYLYCPVEGGVRYGTDADASRVLIWDVRSAVWSHVTIQLY